MSGEVPNKVRLSRVRDYAHLMRLHQRAGIWLLLWPCWWSIALAGSTDPSLYVLFAAAALLMRASGCIINDITDRNYDAQVARTRDRPLASGAISVPQALRLLALLLGLSACIAFWLGTEVFLWSLAAMPLVLLYPWMKRITWWPQFFLGLTFNWGALVGWVAVRGELGWPAFWLYIACMFWTLGYDTIYAHQDKEDDARIGVKSTARLLHHYSKWFIAACYGIFSGIAWWVIQPQAWAAVLFICACLHLIWQLLGVNLDRPVSCKKVFISNAMLGWLLWASILITYG